MQIFWIFGRKSLFLITSSLESALGQFVLSKSTVSEMTETLHEEYEAWRVRDLSTESVAYLFIDTVYEPLRRWGQKTGVLCVWAICEDGRKVLLSLSTTNSESYESCLEVVGGLAKRGMQTPVTITTDGASGLTKAIDAMWPKSLRIRCWFHKMQNLQQKVPAQLWPEVKAGLGIQHGHQMTPEPANQPRQGWGQGGQAPFPGAAGGTLAVFRQQLTQLGNDRIVLGQQGQQGPGRVHPANNHNDQRFDEQLIQSRWAGVPVCAAQAGEETAGNRPNAPS